MARKPFSMIKPHQSSGSSIVTSICFSLIDNSDVLGVGISPPRLEVYVHPAFAHALDCDLLAININLIFIDRGDR